MSGVTGWNVSSSSKEDTLNTVSEWICTILFVCSTLFISLFAEISRTYFIVQFFWATRYVGRRAFNSTTHNVGRPHFQYSDESYLIGLTDQSINQPIKTRRMSTVIICHLKLHIRIWFTSCVITDYHHSSSAKSYNRSIIGIVILINAVSLRPFCRLISIRCFIASVLVPGLTFSIRLLCVSLALEDRNIVNILFVVGKSGSGEVGWRKILFVFALVLLAISLKMRAESDVYDYSAS